MSIEARRPCSKVAAGVYGNHPSLLVLIMSAKSKKQRGHFAVAPAARAFWLTPTIARPVGSMKPFCEPATAMSIPQSSMRNSIQPIELTPSTKSRAGWLSSSRRSRTALMSLVTPVAVSLWVTITALISWCLSSLRISRYLSSGTPSPQTTSTSITSMK